MPPFLIPILNALSGLVNPLLDFLTKKAFLFIGKHWKIILPVFLGFLLIGFVVYTFYKQQSEIAKWKNEAARLHGMELVAKNTYEVPAIEENKTPEMNEELKKRLQQTKRQLNYYSNLYLQYKIKIDSITTQPMTACSDSASTNSAVNIAVAADSMNRGFSTTYNDELFLSGYFQTRSPFLLFISELSLKSIIDLAVSYDEKNDTYFGTVNTNSQWLKPTNFKVSIIPRPTRLEYFYGGNINYNNGFSGIGLTVGLKRGNWAIYTGADFVKENYYKAGIIKYGLW